MSDSAEPEPQPKPKRAPRPRRRLPWKWLRRLCVSVLVSLAIYTCWIVANREWTRRQSEYELNDGVVIHSVGKRPSSPFGKAPAARADLPEGVEFGFRLWNPDQRRLPPTPAPVPPEDEPVP